MKTKKIRNKHKCPSRQLDHEVRRLPVDVMDFLCKAGAYLNGFFDDTDRAIEIKERLIKHCDRLLEKYDF